MNQYCRTTGNFFNLSHISKKFTGWGFCSGECYINAKPEIKLLRVKRKVDILSESLCATFNRRRLKVKFVPKVLCIGLIETFKESVWYRDKFGFTKIKDNKRAMRYGQAGYVASPGTCDGDSGGPAFVKEDKNFIVTGKTTFGLYKKHSSISKM